MKKSVSFVILLAVLVSVFTVAASAASGSSDIAPFYNNVYHVKSEFIINQNGNAEISASYRGNAGTVTSAYILVNIYKNTSSTSWTEVDYWEDYSYSSNYSNTFNTSVGRGTYKAEITYIIYGNGGDADVITQEITKIQLTSCKY